MATAHEEPEFDLPEDEGMDIHDIHDTTMVTLDGVVMGPQVNGLIIF